VRSGHIRVTLEVPRYLIGNLRGAANGLDAGSKDPRVPENHRRAIEKAVSTLQSAIETLTSGEFDD
jgi:hypothetical protein